MNIYTIYAQNATNCLTDPVRLWAIFHSQLRDSGGLPGSRAFASSGTSLTSFEIYKNNFT
jgi:hypothetical protein